MMERDLEEELSACNWFLEKIRTNKDYAQTVYAALCNMRWQPQDVWPVLKDEYWTCSWRYAGGTVAELRNCNENYMDYYCSGGEGIVTDEIREDFAKIGWHPSEWPND